MTSHDSLPPTLNELKRIRQPRLVHALIVAAGNHIRYFGQRAEHALNPDMDSPAPVKRPNFELREYVGRLKDV